jgi:septum formation topological specificity factor MinE
VVQNAVVVFQHLEVKNEKLNINKQRGKRKKKLLNVNISMGRMTR